MNHESKHPSLCGCTKEIRTGQNRKMIGFEHVFSFPFSCPCDACSIICCPSLERTSYPKELYHTALPSPHHCVVNGGLPEEELWTWYKENGWLPIPSLRPDAIDQNDYF